MRLSGSTGMSNVPIRNAGDQSFKIASSFSIALGLEIGLFQV
jgi:hypothetical protein